MHNKKYDTENVESIRVEELEATDIMLHARAAVNKIVV